ncbi:N-acetyl-gamma-glutamyl-phosphate reductase [Halofilum ochraceum]|uniref:N-acetyl-gamma-glutamyl-phosphate reductase n=1 Tax=Halofilum ochraceum TaxID=1611323 RepID=UPI00082F91A0|nr:N-acetyl-gamma-glutamyl-phosphate reductase [Halofilum ochraceum]
MIRVGIVGGTGYTGVEVLRLLAGRSDVEVIAITSRGADGQRVDARFPNLRGVTDLVFETPAAARLTECDIVFFATPNGTAMEQAPALLESGVRVVDVSADFRLRDRTEYAHWYGREHVAPEWLAQAVYGLPEVHRDAIRSARLVANPGCYPTTIQLGLLPLVEAGIVDPHRLVASAVSGATGAGRKERADLLLAETADSTRAYGAGGHRHLPEIRQGLNDVAATPVELSFVPHLVPQIRGIHATLFAELTGAADDLQHLYETRYAAEPFVDVLPPGSHPETRSVRGANVCRMAVHRPDSATNRVIVLAVIDNLVKGAAGQAIQNMNLMCGLDEATGLGHVALLP